MALAADWQVLLLVLVGYCSCVVWADDTQCEHLLECTTLLDIGICERWMRDACKGTSHEASLILVKWTSNGQMTDGAVDDPFAEAVTLPQRHRQPSTSDSQADTPRRRPALDSKQIVDRIRALLQCEATLQPVQPTIRTAVQLAQTPGRHVASSTTTRRQTNRVTSRQRTTTTTTTTTSPTTSTTTATALKQTEEQPEAPTATVLDGKKSSEPAESEYEQKLLVIDSMFGHVQQMPAGADRQPDKIQVPRFSGTIVHFDDQLYLIGGRQFNNVTPSERVDVFVSGGWRRADHSLNVGRSLQAVAQLGNSWLMVCGCGSPSAPCAGTCELRAPDARWTLIDAPYCALNSALAAIGNKFYLSGGSCDERAQSTVYSYDVTSRQWQKAPSLQTARFSHASIDVSIAGYDILLVCGGLGTTNNKPASGKQYLRHLSSCEMLDMSQPAPDWFPVGSLKIPRAQLSLVALDAARVLAVGGIGHRGRPVTAVEQYDVYRDEWTPADWLLRQASYSNNAVVVPTDYQTLHT